MFYPVPYEYHDLIVDRRDGRPARLREQIARHVADRRRGRK